jgi:hypothetical protein
MNYCLNSKGETIMENQNILTIKFNTLDDLAVQVADWNERLNHQCCGNCSDTEVHTATVGETIDVEVEAPVVEEKADTNPQPEPVEVVPVQEDVPVTDFEGKPTKSKKEEKVEPVTDSVVEPAPAETPTEEPVTIQTPEQDAALDVTAEPVDKKAFYKEFREWMGEDGVKAKKALAIFSKHGVTRPSSDSLTDDLITDLKSIMAEEA